MGAVTSAFDYVQRYWDELVWLTQEHIIMTATALGIAFVISVPLGIIASRYRRLQFVILWLAGLGQTTPSLALLGLLMPFLGIGFPLAIAALTVRAVLPILINTCVGIMEVSDAVIESARGMGMTRRQILTMIELPLAAPLIAAGVRTAAVQCVSIATLAAFVGAGGLGDMIFQGVLEVSTPKLLLGVVPAALLALGADLLLGRLEWWITPRGIRATG